MNVMNYAGFVNYSWIIVTDDADFKDFEWIMATDTLLGLPF